MKVLQNMVVETIIPMGRKSKLNDIEIRKDWTNPYGVKCKESAIPRSRPTYDEWSTELKLNEVSYQYHPDAKGRAELISSVLGIPTKPKLIDHLLGRDVWNPERYE